MEFRCGPGWSPLARPAISGQVIHAAPGGLPSPAAQPLAPTSAEHSVNSASGRKACPELHEERFDLYLGGRSVGDATTIDCGHEVWIAELYMHPDHRGRGLATSLLEAIFCRHAGRVLALAAAPFERSERSPARPAKMLSADELAAWYGRHGFHRDGGHRMVRHPSVPEAVTTRPELPGPDAIRGRNDSADRQPRGREMEPYTRGAGLEMEL
jgi:GNAT superfamily N-acetyltransferase